MLAAILKPWGLFVPVEVALGIDDGVFLAEVVRTFLADSVGVMREGPDAGIGGTGLSLCDKSKQTGVGHGSR